MPELNLPPVSVVLPVYNGVKMGAIYLRKAMETLRDQDYVGKIQVVIVDDGSTDNTGPFVRQLLRTWSPLPANRIFDVIAAEHRGVTKALNRGIKESTGDFIARCDADDYCAPERIRLQVEYMAEHPHCGVVFSTIRTVDSGGIEKDVWYYAPGEVRRESFRNGNPVCHGSAMIRRTVMNRAGIYNESYPHAQDYEYFWRLSKFSKLASLPPVLYFYRVHARRITADPIKSKVQRTCSVRIQKQIRSELDHVSQGK